MALVSVNPKNKQTIKEFDELSDSEIADKINLAYEAFSEWKNFSYKKRSEYMSRAADVLRKNSDKYAKIITDEVGKTISASKAEVEKCASVCDFYSKNTESFLAPETIESDASQSLVRYDPLGVILAVMPWNFPFWQVFRFAAPGIMAGNTGVLKHASNVQMSAFAIEEVFNEAGFPEGCFINLCIGSSKVEAVIRNPKIAAATLTGSEKAGSSVASISGEEIKKTVLELGGSDPFIVLEDADLDQAVDAAVTARLQFNAGQSCIAAKRFILQENISDSFIAKLKEKVSALKIGDPLDPSVDVGPLTNQQMLDDINNQIDRSVEMGAEVVCGGRSDDENGYFFNPAVVVNLTEDMPALSEETFGPVFAVAKVKTVEDAITLANKSIYGLGANLFTADTEKAKNEIAPQIESGAVFINGPMKSDPRLPFGGIKKSGYGRELSHYGIKEFVNIKTVWVK